MVMVYFDVVCCVGYVDGNVLFDVIFECFFGVMFIVYNYEDDFVLISYFDYKIVLEILEMLVEIWLLI